MECSPERFSQRVDDGRDARGARPRGGFGARFSAPASRNSYKTWGRSFFTSITTGRAEARGGRAARAGQGGRPLRASTTPPPAPVQIGELSGPRAPGPPPARGASSGGRARRAGGGPGSSSETRPPRSPPRARRARGQGGARPPAPRQAGGCKRCEGQMNNASLSLPLSFVRRFLLSLSFARSPRPAYAGGGWKKQRSASALWRPRQFSAPHRQERPPGQPPRAARVERAAGKKERPRRIEFFPPEKSRGPAAAPALVGFLSFVHNSRTKRYQRDARGDGGPPPPPRSTAGGRLAGLRGDGPRPRF